MNGYIDERLNDAIRNCPRKVVIRWHSMNCTCSECLETDAYVCHWGAPLSFISPPVSIRELEE